MVIKIFPRTQDLMEERCCLHSVFAPQDLYSRSDIVLPDRATLLSEICMFMLSIFISSIFNVRNIVFPTSDIFHKKVFIKLYVMARWIWVGRDHWYSFKIEKNILQRVILKLEIFYFDKNILQKKFINQCQADPVNPSCTRTKQEFDWPLDDVGPMPPHKSRAYPLKYIKRKD